MYVPVGQLSNQPSWQQRGNHPGLYGVTQIFDSICVICG